MPRDWHDSGLEKRVVRAYGPRFCPSRTAFPARQPLACELMFIQCRAIPALFDSSGVFGQDSGRLDVVRDTRAPSRTPHGTQRLAPPGLAHTGHSRRPKPLISLRGEWIGSPQGANRPGKLTTRSRPGRNGSGIPQRERDSKSPIPASPLPSEVLSTVRGSENPAEHRFAQTLSLAGHRSTWTTIAHARSAAAS